MVQKQNYIKFLLHLCLGWKLKAEESYLIKIESSHTKLTINLL